MDRRNPRRDEEMRPAARRRPSREEIEEARRRREARRRQKNAPPPPPRTEEQGHTVRAWTRSAPSDPRRGSEVAPRPPRPEKRPRTDAVRREAPREAKVRPPRKKISMRVRVLAGLFGGLVLFSVLSLTVLFPINEISVSGESHYTDEQIIKESGLLTGQNIFLSGKGSDALVEKSLPYIKDAVVHKQLLSGKVTIEVTETAAHLCTKHDGKWIVLDAQGKVLESPDNPPEGVTVLSGLSIDKAEPGETVAFFEESKAKALWELCEVLSLNQVQGVTLIDLDDSLDTKIKYQNRITIRLGIPTELDTKIRYAMTVIREDIKSDAKGILDTSSAKNYTFKEDFS